MQKRNDGKKQISLRMNPELIRTLKMYALTHDTTLAATIEKAVAEMLTREKATAPQEVKDTIDKKLERAQRKGCLFRGV